jgi:hypothetical protein
MKHTVLVLAGLLALSGPAFAGSGYVSGTGFGPSQAQACAAAQGQAQSAAVVDGMRYGKSNAHVTSFGACGCSFSSTSGQWQCTVGANYSTD